MLVIRVYSKRQDFQNVAPLTQIVLKLGSILKDKTGLIGTRPHPAQEYHGTTETGHRRGRQNSTQSPFCQNMCFTCEAEATHWKRGRHGIRRRDSLPTTRSLTLGTPLAVPNRAISLLSCVLQLLMKRVRGGRICKTMACNSCW